MPAPRDRRHILVPTPANVESYQPHGRKIEKKELPSPESRRRHGRALARSLTAASQEQQQRRDAIDIEVHGAQPGLYLEFASVGDVDLNLISLEDRRAGIDLTAVRTITDAAGVTTQYATVFVPDGRLRHFFNRFEKYSLTTEKRKGERRYEDMLDRIASLRLATLEQLWTDALEAYPAAGEVIWWEVWLRRHDGNEYQRFAEYAQLQEMALSERRLEMDERIVVLARGAREQLAQSVDVLNDLAEVRKAKESVAFFDEQPAEEQVQWVDDLLARLSTSEEAAPAVCLLDTGVTREHQLIAASLSAENLHACDPAWGTDDHHGHGTEMAGLALYGDLTPLLASDAPVNLRHQLESVKILPPGGQTPPDLYGAVTADATSRAEIGTPARPRCYSMAVTATDQRDRGQPTSWSVAIDALAAGRSFDVAHQRLTYTDPDELPQRRLIFISAGNVFQLEADHLSRSDVEPVHDPAQAWNAVTVGAFTDKAVLHGDQWQGWQALAPPGELSPWSTTSVGFQTGWPMKPDVVFEGGNVAINGNQDIDQPVPDLSLLTTNYRPAERSFQITTATSAATAQVARMGAVLMADYPEYWPETVRALIIHSARWTDQMRKALEGVNGKTARSKLVRRYGFGVPSLSRATRSATDALTLVVQDTIRPFFEGKMGEMHFFELPWPKTVLQGLGEQHVQLRITLSYFVEPTEGRRGWANRYRYASHGLRFEVKQPEETTADFRKRLNKQALDKGEKKPKIDGDSKYWYLGPIVRNTGSLHSDIWVGTAADLAERGVVGVYPVSGWWKDQKTRDRSASGAPYSLVVSVEIDAEQADIWTPVATEIGVPAQAVVGI